MDLNPESVILLSIFDIFNQGYVRAVDLLHVFMHFSKKRLMIEKFPKKTVLWAKYLPRIF